MNVNGQFMLKYELLTSWAIESTSSGAREWKDAMDDSGREQECAVTRAAFYIR